MRMHDTSARSSLVVTWFGLLGGARPAVDQDRVFARLALLTVANALALGRHTITQLLVALGVGELDWTAWYRVFNRDRCDPDTLHEHLLSAILAVLPATGPI